MNVINFICREREGESQKKQKKNSHHIIKNNYFENKIHNHLIFMYDTNTIVYD